MREEELLYSQYGTTVLSCAEGAHVAANDTVATGYRSDDARTRQTRIDELVVKLVKQQHDKALALLRENRDKLETLSRHLYEKETITGDEFMELMKQ